MTSTIPKDVLKIWEFRAGEAERDILENLIEFLEFYDELNHGDKLKAYKEAAKANRMAGETFRGKFGLVLRFRDCDLREWFKQGISFDHLAHAPSLAEVIKLTPAALIEKAIDPGSANGDTMTVDEMIEFALGGSDKKTSPKWHVEQAFSKLLKLPSLLKWDSEKAQRFETKVKELIEEFSQ